MFCLDANLLACFAFAGVVYADTEAAWQIQISQPLVVCTIIGLILGDISVGLTVGILMQLPFLAEVPAGGSKISMSALGSLIAAMLVVQFGKIYHQYPNTVLGAGLLFGVLVSWLAEPLRVQIRRINFMYSSRAEKAVADGAFNNLSRLVYAGVATAILFGTLCSFVMYAIGYLAIQGSTFLWGTESERIFRFIQPVMLGTGFAVIGKLFISRQSGLFGLGGLALGGILLALL